MADFKFGADRDIPKSPFSFRKPRGTRKANLGGLSVETGFHMTGFSTGISALFDELALAPNEVAHAWGSEVNNIFADVVELTPVDTGTARRGWRGPHFKVKSNMLTATFWNNVPYIVWLEMGSSMKAPLGMVRITLARRSRNIGQMVVGLRSK